MIRNTRSADLYQSVDQMVSGRLKNIKLLPFYLSWKYPRNLESPRVSSPGFGNDSKMMGNVSRCYSTGRPRVTTPNEDRFLAVYDKRNGWSTASDLSCLLSFATGTTVSRQTMYRRLGTLFYMPVGLSDVFHLPQLTVASDKPGVESMHYGQHNSDLV
ncbi:transposable element Tcb2 transposase [Trichonephila clavipes]|nr:transposable element Tcb2 transposase [Trichonephila clavipes]